MSNANELIGLEVVWTTPEGEELVATVESANAGWLTLVADGEPVGKARPSAVTVHETKEDEEESVAKKMAKTLAQYRAGYVHDTTVEGAKTQHNGDDIARWLKGHTPEEVAQLADSLCGWEKGAHQARYENLNRGQLRMNAGNKIRAAWKKGSKPEWFAGHGFEMTTDEAA